MEFPVPNDFHAAAARFPDPFRLIIRESAGSTNDELRKLAETGAADGCILLALNQTAGRGRRGTAWFSPAAESLAFSVLLRPTEPKALWPRLALAAGLAVAEGVESFQLSTGIKWPNDVWIGQRKVAGILVEAGANYAIVGIGININTCKFPEEVTEIATSLSLASGKNHEREDVLAAVIWRFSQRRHQISNEFDELLDAVRLRCVLTGHHVSLQTSKGPRQGVVEGIAAGGELMLRTSDGLEKLIQADEVRILR